MGGMGRCHLCMLFTVLFLILVSLALLVTCVVTDFWYEVDATDSSNNTIRRQFSYTFGMWRKCYSEGVPIDVPAENREGDCVFTYKDLVKRQEDNLSADDMRYLHLERSWVALMITAAGLQLFTILALLCGLWPGECRTLKRATLYLIAALMTLVAAMAAMASGICFIALRDIDRTSRNIYPTEADTMYQWSFIIGWVGTGLCLIEGFIFLGLLRIDYDDVAESGSRYQTM